MPVPFAVAPRGQEAPVDLCVVGNLTIDVILRGIDAMPSWGQEVLCSEKTEVVAGQAGGMAFAATALGVRTDVVAEVGDDGAGARIRRELEAAGVGVEALRLVRDGATPMTVALVRRDGERAFVSDLGRLHAGGTAWSPPWPNDASKVVALVGTNNLPDLDLDDAARAFATARRAGTLTVFDPGWYPQGWSDDVVRGVRAVIGETDLFVPNLDEARALTGETDVTSVLHSLGALTPGIVVVKDGRNGSVVCHEGRVIVVHALDVDVDNAVGAGDVFDAGAVAGFLRGGDVIDAMVHGTACASLYVARRTNRFPTYEECQAMMKLVTITTMDDGVSTTPS